MTGSHADWPGRDRPGLRRLLTLVVALVAVAAVVGGGSLITPQEVTSTAAPAPLVGRTSSICAVVAPVEGQPADQASAVTSVTAVGIREAPGQEGQLIGASLDSGKELLKVSEQGKGTQLGRVDASVLLQGEGVMATAASGVVFSAATSGPDAGLSAAPCLPPGTQHWFTGIGGGEADRTELVLSNPDDAQAEVDLRYYGRNGRVAVAGSPGVVIGAHASRTVSLSALDSQEGPISVQIQASTGRVTAAARRSRTDALKPAGVDWQVPAVAPSTTTVIPGVPAGAGGRELVVVNPGAQRASVQVQVLGLHGGYQPSGAATVEVPAESTASVDLVPGLTGEAGAIELSSDLPVTGSVLSTNQRDGASADLAVQSAAAPLIRTGVSALATTSAGDAELVLTNAADTDAQVSFEVLTLDGVVIRTDDVLLAANSTATRRLTSTPPSYLVVRVPDGSAVVGDVVLTQPDGDAAGLATIPLTSPDLASRAPSAVPDPAAGR